jgi:spermidine/putrescine transport system permease protein
MAQTTLGRLSGNQLQQEIDYAQLGRDLAVRRVGKIAYVINALACYFFLWAPIVVLVIFSFNNSRSVARWEGFTLQWYTGIFNTAVGEGTRAATAGALDALSNSLVIGVVSTVIATILATMLSLAMVRFRFPGKQFIEGLLYLPVVIPEIAQGVSLAIFFSVIFNLIEGMNGTARPTLGLGSVIIGHVVFNVAFVVVVIRARLADMNPRLEEAARDLGADEWRAFWRVTFPLLLPAIIAGALLAFTLSLDDYLITAYNSGAGSTTLTVFVFGLMRRGISPEINAISTLMILFSIILIGLSLLLQGRNAATARA